MADDKKELDPAKVIVFICIMVFLGIIFTADDLTGVGELMDPIEFLITLLLGAGYGGKIGFFKNVPAQKETQKDVPAIEAHEKEEKDEASEKEEPKKVIDVKGEEVPKARRFKKCPFCGEQLKFKKTPKYCPYCEEELNEAD